MLPTLPLPDISLTLIGRLDPHYLCTLFLHANSWEKEGGDDTTHYTHPFLPTHRRGQDSSSSRCRLRSLRATILSTNGTMIFSYLSDGTPDFRWKHSLLRLSALTRHHLHTHRRLPAGCGVLARFPV